MNFTQVTLENLHDPMRYEHQIDRIFSKMKSLHGVGALFETKQESVPFFSFGYDRRNLAKILATSVKKEEYFLSTHSQYVIRVKNKERIIFKFTLTDKIVVGVLASVLTDILQPFVSDNVYSYRKKTMPKHQVIALADYIKEQRHVKYEKGLYFLQTDIKSFSDEIWISESSPFWDQLRDNFHTLGIRPSGYQWRLIQAAIRPEYTDINGALQMSIRGIPTGSPITPLLYNHYPARVDHMFTHLPSMFYARYSDDIIICDPSESKVLLARESVMENMKTLGLGLSDKKTLAYYLNPAGLKGQNPKWEGANRLEILGYSVNACGDFTISRARQKKLLHQIRARIANSLALVQDESLDQRGLTVCFVVNKFYTDSSMGNNPVIFAVKNSTDRKQLGHLDYLIALYIAECLSGVRGTRAFRTIPYKMIREEWGLMSLVRMRDTLFRRKGMLNS